MSEQIKVTINEQEFDVDAGARLIDVCRDKGFGVPSFCYYHDLEFARAKGSHQIFKNKATGKMTVVPMHKRDLPKGTMLSILKQAGIDKGELL